MLKVRKGHLITDELLSQSFHLTGAERLKELGRIAFRVEIRPN